MRSQGKPSVMAHVAGEHDVIDGEFEELNGRGGGGGGALATVTQHSATRVQSQYTTAMVCPVRRDMKKVVDAVVREAELAGEDFMYSFSIGKGEKRTLIEGVSIDGAMILSRNFGNCIPEIEIAQEAPTHWIFRATFVDLETGATLPRLFRQSKGTLHGKFDPERKLDIALQIGQSKAQRNVIVKAMPTYLVNAAVKAAKAAAAASIKDLPQAISDACATFQKMNVTPEQIETFIGAPRAQWNANDIVRLRATYKAIADRQTTVDQEFPAPGSVNDSDEAPAVVTPDKAAAQRAATPMPGPGTNMFTGETSAAPIQAPVPNDAPPAAAPGTAPANAPPATPAPLPEPAPSPSPAPVPAPAPVAAPDPPKPEGRSKKATREPGEEG